MKNPLILSLLFLMTLCVYGHSSDVSLKNSTKYRARITYYYSTAPWWDRVACQNTTRARVGTTVAAHPKFKMGTKIYIPYLKGKIGNGYFIVQDRGPAVTRKSAAKGKGYVFDVYIQKSQYSRHKNKNPMWMDVYILK